MIQVTPEMRIRVAVEPADFRKGSDPFSGSVFVFGNKSRKAVKILVYDGQGFWLCQKRLSKGPQTEQEDSAKEPMPPENVKGHGRNGAAAYTGAEKVKISHQTLKPGDSCPECHKSGYLSPHKNQLKKLVKLS
jgi:hypothetical protein